MNSPRKRTARPKSHAKVTVKGFMMPDPPNHAQELLSLADTEDPGWLSYKNLGEDRKADSRLQKHRKSGEIEGWVSEDQHTRPKKRFAGLAQVMNMDHTRKPQPADIEVSSQVWTKSGRKLSKEESAGSFVVQIKSYSGRDRPLDLIKRNAENFTMSRIRAGRFENKSFKDMTPAAAASQRTCFMREPSPGRAESRAASRWSIRRSEKSTDEHGGSVKPLSITQKISLKQQPSADTTQRSFYLSPSQPGHKSPGKGVAQTRYSNVTSILSTNRITQENYTKFNRNPYFLGAIRRMMIEGAPNDKSWDEIKKHRGFVVPFPHSDSRRVENPSVEALGKTGNLRSRPPPSNTQTNQPSSLPQASSLLISKIAAISSKRYPAFLNTHQRKVLAVNH